jgi:DNA-binding NarL/FixJ family response regulator
METVRILLADDHAAVRRGLRSLLESQPQWKVCGEARTGREAVEQARLLKPDLVLLDVTMPELNGLEAARQILDQSPRTHVLLSSMHQSDELTDEARRSGAEGVVLKSDARELTAAIQSLFRAVAIHLAGADVRDTRHVAAFFSSDEERYRILGPFIAEGLMRGEKAFHIIDGGHHDAYVHSLESAGIDVDRAAAQGQIEIAHWDKMYLEGGHFEQQAMLNHFQQLFTGRAAEGSPRTRAIGYMEWALVPPPSVGELVEYESRLNEFLPNFDDVVVCAYDLAKFDGKVIVDVMRAHPAVIIGCTLHQNPFYAQPSELIEELRQNKEPRSGGRT